jgi:hypothetical protein
LDGVFHSSAAGSLYGRDWVKPREMDQDCCLDSAVTSVNATHEGQLGIREACRRRCPCAGSGPQVPVCRIPLLVPGRDEALQEMRWASRYLVLKRVQLLLPSRGIPDPARALSSSFYLLHHMIALGELPLTSSGIGPR